MAVLSVAVASALLYVTVLGFAALVVGLQTWTARSREDLKNSVLHPGEEFVSSRGRHGWASLSLSMFASFTGNWVIFLPPDVGATYGWPGVVGYAVSCGLPYAMLMWLAPQVRAFTPTTGFAGTDHLLLRYGRVVQLAATAVSLAFMFLTLSIELTTVGISMKGVTGGEYPVLAAVIPVAVVTLAYSTYGGLQASILTDKYQGIVIFFLSLPFLVAVFVTGGGSVNGVSSAEIGSGGAVAAAVLIFSIWPTFLLDQGIWQRVWAGRSVRDVRIAFGVAGLFAVCTVTVFGVAGIICQKAAQAAAREGELVSIFAYLTNTMPAGWVGVLAVLAVTCVSSSVDTYQTALVSLFAYDMSQHKLSFNWARLMIVLLNIPAIVLASLELDILMLAMAANVVCAVIAGPLVVNILPCTTKFGLLVGVLVSAITFLSCGWISTGDFVKGLAFFAPADFSTVPYVVAFISTPLLGASATIGFSCVHTWLSKRFGKQASQVPAVVLGSSGCPPAVLDQGGGVTSSDLVLAAPEEATSDGSSQVGVRGSAPLTPVV